MSLYSYTTEIYNNSLYCILCTELTLKRGSTTMGNTFSYGLYKRNESDDSWELYERSSNLDELKLNMVKS